MTTDERLRRQLGAKRRDLKDAELWLAWFKGCDNPCPSCVARRLVWWRPSKSGGLA